MSATSFDTVLARLGSSKFRASFHLTKATRAYAQQKGLPVIKQHAEDFISTRLAPAYIPNDGKQTPMKSHPLFIAQHACASYMSSLSSYACAISRSTHAIKTTTSGI